MYETLRAGLRSLKAGVPADHHSLMHENLRAGASRLVSVPADHHSLMHETLRAGASRLVCL